MKNDRNVAEVNNEIVTRDKASDKLKTIQEKHPMRYFSIPEIALLASETGFSIIGSEEFLTGEQPTLESRSVFIQLQKA